MRIYVASNSVGRCHLGYTFKEAKEWLKKENLGDMPKFDGEQNGIRSYVGINDEDSYIQVCELIEMKKNKKDIKYKDEVAMNLFGLDYKELSDEAKHHVRNSIKHNTL